MYKVQVFYDEDTRDSAIKIAAFRLGGVDREGIAALWEDRQYFCAMSDGQPHCILQAIEVAELEEGEEEFFIEEDEVYDGDEIWLPLGWDIADVAAFMMSNVFELSGCENYLQVYFYV